MNITKRFVSVIVLTIIALVSIGNVWGNENFEHIRLRDWRLTNDTVFSDTICYGDDYDDHGFHIVMPEPGLILDSIPIGDSTVYLNLYVGRVYNDVYFENICYGDDYTGHGFTVIHPNPGLNIIEHTDTTVVGCDSITVLKLYVNEIFRTVYEADICQGESYEEHGFHYINPAVGYYRDSIPYQTAAVCDSVVVLHLRVSPSYHLNFTDTICFGDSYRENGFNSETPSVGMHFDTLNKKTKIYRCDSVRTLQLYVAPVYETSFTESICYGEEYHGHGFNLTDLEVGQYIETDSLRTNVDCDSIVILNLYVNPVYDTLFTDTICYGDEYQGHGFDTINLPVGWYRDTIFGQSQSGCDSTIMLELYVAPTKTRSFTDMMCYGEHYDSLGFEHDSLPVGWFYDTAFLYTTLGCDSVVSLALYVALTYDTLFGDTICQGYDYSGHGFILPADSLHLGMNVKSETYPTIFECDSVVRLRLYVAPTHETLFGDTICQGDDYTEHGFELYNIDSIGWHHETKIVPTIYGCDSTLLLDLYVAPSPIVDIYDTICYGEDYHEYNFDTINPPVGQHLLTKDKHTHIFGCDSLVRLHLTVGALHDILITDTICYGESYHENGFNYDEPEVGRYFDTLDLETTFKCDSIVNLNLYVAPTYEIDVFDSICYGENYTEHGFHIMRPIPGTYFDTTNVYTQIGCDSIYNLILKVDYTFESNDSITGETITIISSDITTGEYTYSIAPIVGCDEYNWSLWVDSTYNDSTFQIPNEYWILTPNKNTCKVIVTKSGKSTLKLETGNWCSKIIKTLDIMGTWYSVDEKDAIKASVYPNPTNGVINIECENIETVNIYNMSGQIVKTDRFGTCNKATINVEDLNSSLFILEIVTKEGRCMKQFSKIY